MRASVLILSVLLITCTSKPALVHDYIGVYDIAGVPFKYEIEYSIMISDKDDHDSKDHIRYEVNKMIQRTLSRFDLHDIAIVKRDSIEALTFKAIKENISYESIKISDVKVLNLLVGESVYYTYVSRYGKLDRIKKM